MEVILIVIGIGLIAFGVAYVGAWLFILTVLVDIGTALKSFKGTRD
jgi:hypothetical protein